MIHCSYTMIFTEAEIPLLIKIDMDLAAQYFQKTCSTTYV